MGKVSHIRGAGGAMRKLTEREVDEQIAENRRRFDDEFDRLEARRMAEPIPTAPSLWARFVRWVRDDK